jgi:apolipoprotein N-acyltransferase
LPPARNKLFLFLTHPTSRATDATMLAGGAALTGAFAPFHLFPLAVLAPVLLFAAVSGCSAGRAAWRGWLFGLGLFGTGVSWVYVSMHDFGHMSLPLAAFATFLFCGLLAVFVALFAWLQARWFEPAHPLHATLVLPALWLLCEWLRGWVLTGFPWLDLGYSQVGTPLGGYASWIGVYGVTLACALSAGLLWAALRRPAAFLTRYLPALAAIWIGGWLAGQVAWTQPSGAPVRVALIQGNVPLSEKWAPQYRNGIVRRYLRLSAEAPDAKLTVWPEAAIPAYLDQMTPIIEVLERAARERGTDFLIGTIERVRAGRAYYNSVVEIGSHPGSYRKQHLVPFGEYLPLKPLFGWLLDFLQIPMSDFSSAGPDQRLLEAAGERIGVSICYEDAFGEEVIRALPGATVLVNVSEDAWFGNSFAPHQRMQMAQMRALETGRPMLRAANTGPSAIISGAGVVERRSPQFVPYVLRGDVQPRTGETLYARLGNYPAVIAAVMLLMAGAWRSGARRRAKSGSRTG